MPGSYKCPKGGSHQWVTKKDVRGDTQRKCAKCGQARPV